MANERDGFDIQSASAGPGAIVYDQFGALHLYDLASGQTRRVAVTIAADLPQLRPHFEKVQSKQILHAALSPSGKRVLFEAHGEILAVPAEKGDVRNLTRSPGVADRDPAWSPDGKWVAWFSDESGEYALHLRAPDGLGPVRKIDLGEPPSFFYSPRWSPDSKKIAYTDKRLNLWLRGPRPSPRPGSSTPTSTTRRSTTSTRPGRRTAAGSRTPSSSATTCAPSSCTRWPRRRAARSPTAAAT